MFNQPNKKEKNSNKQNQLGPDLSVLLLVIILEKITIQPTYIRR